MQHVDAAPLLNHGGNHPPDGVFGTHIGFDGHGGTALCLDGGDDFTCRVGRTTATRAPCSASTVAQCARPLPAPVTIATLPASFSFSHSLPLSLSGRLDGQRPPSSWNSNS
jgi:hypothetical protein